MRGNWIRVAYTSEASTTAPTRLFRNNRTLAVRLPKAVAFPEGIEEVEILVVGEARLIVPNGRRSASYFAEGPFADGD